MLVVMSELSRLFLVCVCVFGMREYGCFRCFSTSLAPIGLCECVTNVRLFSTTLEGIRLFARCFCRARLRRFKRLFLCVFAKVFLVQVYKKSAFFVSFL